MSVRCLKTFINPCKVKKLTLKIDELMTYEELN